MASGSEKIDRMKGKLRENRESVEMMKFSVYEFISKSRFFVPKKVVLYIPFYVLFSLAFTKSFTKS